MTISVDLAVHLFYGLGHDPAVPIRSSPYYTRFTENYGGIQAFLSKNDLSLDGYVELLRQLWRSRFEETAAAGGYLAAIPNVNLLFSEDGRIPQDESAYVFRHQKEKALLEDARPLFGDRMIVHPDPSVVAERLARKIVADHAPAMPIPLEINAHAYGEMSRRCLRGNTAQFERILEQQLRPYSPRITGNGDLRYCGDRVEGKQEFLDAHPAILDRFAPPRT